ncbi:MAG TPA: hypothetical protein VMG82_28270 [Candidatus Sulfotelmatobacter sp.]|nr:hypothetical protein [Candidatus Sulfotelmatobacter sp.]
MEIVIGIVSVVIGGLITILTAMGVEYLRRPRLHLIIEDPPLDVEYPAGKPARNTRYLRLKLHNKELPRGARWMQRAAALQCRGEITFHHLDDGQDIFGRAMPVRWSNSPELVPSRIVNMSGVVQGQIIDVAKLTPEYRIDVYPGEEEILDVAVRHDADEDCYGNNNEQYFSSPPWRNPRWKLSKGRYLACIIHQRWRVTEQLLESRVRGRRRDRFEMGQGQEG